MLYSLLFNIAQVTTLIFVVTIMIDLLFNINSYIVEVVMKLVVFLLAIELIIIVILSVQSGG